MTREPGPRRHREHDDPDGRDFVTWREFQDFRDDTRSERRALQAQVWGLMAAVFLSIVGVFLQQFVQAIRHPASTPTAAVPAIMWAVDIMLRAIGAN